MVEADGTRRIVDYTADDVHGFNANVRKEGVATKVIAPIAKIVSPLGYGGAYHAPIAAYHAPIAAYHAPIAAAPIGYAGAYHAAAPLGYGAAYHAPIGAAYHY